MYIYVRLPNEVLLEIFTHCAQPESVAVARVCQHWRDIALSLPGFYEPLAHEVDLVGDYAELCSGVELFAEDTRETLRWKLYRIEDTNDLGVNQAFRPHSLCTHVSGPEFMGPPASVKLSLCYSTTLIHAGPPG